MAWQEGLTNSLTSSGVGSSRILVTNVGVFVRNLEIVMKLRWQLLLVTLLFLAPITSRAQIGFEVGGAYQMQGGSFVAPCGCTFISGTGPGYLGAISYDLFSKDAFTFGLRASWSHEQFTSRESGADPITGDHELVNTSFLGLDAFARYTIAHTDFFVQVAPFYDYLLSNNFRHTPDEEGIDSYAPAPMRKYRFGGMIGAGCNFAGFGMTLAPMVGFKLPLSNMAGKNETSDSWQVSSLYASVTLRVNLQR